MLVHQLLLEYIKNHNANKNKKRIRNKRKKQNSMKQNIRLDKSCENLNVLFLFSFFLSQLSLSAEYKANIFKNILHKNAIYSTCIVWQYIGLFIYFLKHFYKHICICLLYITFYITLNSISMWIKLYSCTVATTSCFL